MFEGQVEYIRGETLGISKVENYDLLEEFENRFVATLATALHHVTNQPDTNSGAVLRFCPPMLCGLRFSDSALRGLRSSGPRLVLQSKFGTISSKSTG
jgi:hypothetical protein